MKKVLCAFLALAMAFSVNAASRVFSDSFSTTKTNWTNYQGTWTRANGVQSVTATSNNGGYRYITTNLANVLIESKVRFTNTTSWGVGLVGRYNPTNGANYGVWIYPNNPSAGVSRITIERNLDWFNTWSELTGKSLSTSLGTNWHVLRLTITNNLISAYLDGTLQLEAVDNYHAYGGAGLVVWSAGANITRGQFDGVVITNMSGFTPPAYTNISVTLSWLPIGNALRYEVWSTTNLLRPLTLLTNVGLNTNVTFVYPKVSAEPQRFYAVRGYYWNASGTNVASVTLAWDYTCGTTNDVVRYNVYYGVTSSNYTNYVFVTACTNRMATVSNLPKGSTYFFAATAVDAYGLESDYSTEVSTSIPPPITTTNVTGIPCAITAIR